MKKFVNTNKGEITNFHSLKDLNSMNLPPLKTLSPLKVNTNKVNTNTKNNMEKKPFNLKELKEKETFHLCKLDDYSHIPVLHNSYKHPFVIGIKYNLTLKQTIYTVYGHATHGEPPVITHMLEERLRFNPETGTLKKNIQRFVPCKEPYQISKTIYKQLLFLEDYTRFENKIHKALLVKKLDVKLKQDVENEKIALKKAKIEANKLKKKSKELNNVQKPILENKSFPKTDVFHD